MMSVVLKNEKMSQATRLKKGAGYPAPRKIVLEKKKKGWVVTFNRLSWKAAKMPLDLANKEIHTACLMFRKKGWRHNWSTLSASPQHGVEAKKRPAMGPFF